MHAPFNNRAMTVPIKPAYTLDEVAEALSVSRATITRLVSSGRLRASRIGHRTVRVSHEALMDFLREHETAPRKED
jgi:excisionase family DNA binding protein